MTYSHSWTNSVHRAQKIQPARLNTVHLCLRTQTVKSQKRLLLLISWAALKFDLPVGLIHHPYPFLTTGMEPKKRHSYHASEILNEEMF